MSAERRPTFESRLGEGLNPGTLPLSDEELERVRRDKARGITWSAEWPPILRYLATLDAERSARLEAERDADNIGLLHHATLREWEHEKARAEAAEARVAALTEAANTLIAAREELQQDKRFFRCYLAAWSRFVTALAPPETPGEEPKR